MKTTWGLAIVAGLGLATTGAATDRYVGPGGTPDGVYASWAAATTNIQEAVNVAADGETVWVTNGDYAITGTLVVTNGISLRGFNNDSSSVVIRRTVTNAFRVLLVSNASAVVSGISLTNGTTSTDSDSGGGVYLAAGTVSNCAILRNSRGGGIYVGTSALLVDSVVRANTMPKDVNGAGVRLNGGVVRNCRISENLSMANRTTSGGGVSMTGGLLENSVIFSNGVTDNGGGVYLAGGTVRGCLIYGNMAYNPDRRYGRGGGLYVAASNSAIENCTIAANTARNGGGVCGQSAPFIACSVSNSIVTLNRALSGEGEPNYDGARFVRSCTTAGGTAGQLAPSTFGEGNRFDDPGFVDPAGLDFRLRPGSPALDSGANQDWMRTARDLAGNDRILPAGGSSDMGAYEYRTGPLLGTFVADVTAGLDAAPVVLTATVDGTNLTDLTYTWDFDDDGTPDASGPVAGHRFPAGLHSVRLTVANASGESSTSVRRNYIRITPLTPICVSTNGSATPPYDTWARGLTNLVDALSLAASGSTLIVTGGTYAIPGMLTLGMPVTLLGVNGPSNTIIQGPGCGRLLYLTNSAATVDGFALRNGAGPGFDLSGGEGGGLYVTAGLVRNCLITSNLGPVRRVGVGVYMTGGTVSNCSVFANTGATDGKGGGLYMTGGLIANCRVFGNTLPGGSSVGGGIAATGGRIVNCLVYSNTINSSSTSQGGGIYMSGGAVAIGCLVYSNAVLSTGVGSVQGGGIYGGQAVNCTVVDNFAKVAGSGTYNTILTNSIVMFNTPGISNIWYGSNVAYSCVPITNGLTGPGNTAADPRFADRAARDCRLTAGSPCLDAGVTRAAMSDTVDLDGQPRVKGSGVDMGAYEYAPPVGGALMIIR